MEGTTLLEDLAFLLDVSLLSMIGDRFESVPDDSEFGSESPEKIGVLRERLRGWNMQEHSGHENINMKYFPLIYNRDNSKLYPVGKLAS